MNSTIYRTAHGMEIKIPLEAIQWHSLQTYFPSASSLARSLVRLKANVLCHGKRVRVTGSFLRRSCAKIWTVWAICETKIKEHTDIACRNNTVTSNYPKPSISVYLESCIRQIQVRFLRIEKTQHYSMFTSVADWLNKQSDRFRPQEMTNTQTHDVEWC